SLLQHASRARAACASFSHRARHPRHLHSCPTRRSADLEILEDADYELDGDTLTLDGDEVGPFRLRATDSDVRNNSMQLIQAQLAEIGIEANIEPTDDLGATTEEGDYDSMQFGWQGTPDLITTPHQFWHSSSG